MLMFIVIKVSGRNACLLRRRAACAGVVWCPAIPLSRRVVAFSRSVRALKRLCFGTTDFAILYVLEGNTVSFEHLRRVPRRGFMCLL